MIEVRDDQDISQRFKEGAEEAFDGNCAGVDGRFITDGRSLLLRSACDDKFLARLKTANCGPYGPDNPVPEASTRKLFDDSVRDSKYRCVIRGYVLGAVAGPECKATQPFVCITGPGERIAVVEGHRVLLIQTVTGANRVMVSVEPKSPRLTFLKDDEPVALLVTGHATRHSKPYFRRYSMRSRAGPSSQA